MSAQVKTDEWDPGALGLNEMIIRADALTHLMWHYAECTDHDVDKPLVEGLAALADLLGEARKKAALAIAAEPLPLGAVAPKRERAKKRKTVGVRQNARG